MEKIVDSGTVKTCDEPDHMPITGMTEEKLAFRFNGQLDILSAFDIFLRPINHTHIAPSQRQQLILWGWDFIKNNSLNSLKVSLTRETDTKKAEQFCQMAGFVQVYKFAQLLDHIFVSVSFVRENQRGLRENCKHKLPT